MNWKLVALAKGYCELKGFLGAIAGESSKESQRRSSEPVGNAKPMRKCLEQLKTLMKNQGGEKSQRHG
ncbi:hypothetical protein BVY02_01130 [bacterium J17]|nr:hypothetical protein BVY02_01130 [bacterium J17]